MVQIRRIRMMKESAGGGTRRQQSNDSKNDAARPDSEATSKETLEDLEQTEKISDSTSETADDASNVPSPDGLLDEPGELKDAGPM
jgi:hypothetical protein